MNGLLFVGALLSLALILYLTLTELEGGDNER